MFNLSSQDAVRPKFSLTTLTNHVIFLGIVCLGTYFRFIDIPTSLAGAHTDRLENFLAGMRMIILPWWNLSDLLRQNFFKSLLYTPHGLGDTLFFYPVVFVYDWIGIALTEWNLLAAKALLSVLTVLIVYILVSSLFDSSAGLISATIIALSPSHIAISSHPHHRSTLLIFLQAATVLVYFGYLHRRTWWTAVPAAILLGIQAGCENFYYIVIIILLHYCYVHEVGRSLKENVVAFRQSFVSWLTILVWSPYVFMWMVNILVYWRIGYNQDLTLLGHTLRFASTGQPVEMTASNLVSNMFWIVNQVFNMISNVYPIYSLAFFAALVLSLNHARRFTIRGFAWWWSVIVSLFILLTLRKQIVHPHRALHLLIPSSILVAATVSDGLRSIVQRFRIKGQAWGPGACYVLILALTLSLAPGALTAKHHQGMWDVSEFDSDVYGGMKAAGSVLRTLGNPKMNVFVLTTNTSAMGALEYYFGLSYSNSDYEPNQLFFHEPLYAPPDGVLKPKTLTTAYGFKDFDFYVEFVRQPAYPQKEAVVADLQARGARLVAAIYEDFQDDVPEVRIYSPHTFPFHRYLRVEQERLFDQKFANKDNLFYNVNVGTFIYFGWHWWTKPEQRRAASKVF